MNFELYFSKILFSLYTEIKYEISLFYLKNFFYFFYLCQSSLNLTTFRADRLRSSSWAA